MPECNQCGGDYPQGRADLGFEYCKDCAPPPRKYTVVIQCPKSAYQLLTPGTNPRHIGKKDGGL